MRYRSTTNINLPFRVTAVVNEVGKSTVEYYITIKSTFDAKLNAEQCRAQDPYAAEYGQGRLQGTGGQSQIRGGRQSHIVEVSRVSPLAANSSLRSSVNSQDTAHARLFRNDAERYGVFVANDDAQSLVQAAHQRRLSRSSCSPLLVCLFGFLKVFEKSNYQSVKWVRYLTRANGSYQIVRLLLGYDGQTTDAQCDIALLKREWYM